MNQRAPHLSNRGVTLVEVLIVVAIIALVSGGISVGVIKYWGDAQLRTTETNARAIRGAVKTWWIDHDRSQCPTVDELVAAGTLDKDTTRRDAWGESWRIDCADDDVTVTSHGRDRRAGTADDIRIPPT